MVRREASGAAQLVRIVGRPPPDASLELISTDSLKAGAAIVDLLSADVQRQGEVLRWETIRFPADTTEQSLRLLVLVSTRISDPGDGGAPVIDREGRLVGMLFGYNFDRGETYIVPAEQLARAFPEAFEPRSATR